MQGQIQSKVDTFSESRSGFATQYAALRNLTDSTSKDLRDLEIRRQDALAANDTATADKINELQLSALQFKQKSEQDFYSNAFSYMQADTNRTAQQRAASEFATTMEFNREQRTIDRQDKMATLASEYGVEMTATDTYETILAKISKVVSADKAAEAAYKAAQLSKGQEEEDAEFVYDDILTENISKGGTAMEATNAVVAQMREAGQLLSREEYNKVYAKAVELEANYKKTLAKTTAESTGGLWSRLFGEKATSPYIGSGGLLPQDKIQAINKEIQSQSNFQKAMSDTSVIESPETYAQRFFGVN